MHLLRAALNYVPWKLRRQADASEAEQHLAELEGKWRTYPSLSQVWRRNWGRITPFFNYPPDIWRAIYTTNVPDVILPMCVIRRMDAVLEPTK